MKKPHLSKSEYYKRKLKGLTEHNRSSPGAVDTEKVRFYLEKIEDESPFILATDPEALEKLKQKIEACNLLGDYFRSINKYYKTTGSLEGVRITPFWLDHAKKNIEATGSPFSKADFYKLRRKKKFSRDRVKSLEGAESFKPFSVNGISVTLEDRRITVRFPEKPGLETLETLKKSPLRLKFSPGKRAWVRKYTGQAEPFFQVLRLALLKGGGVISKK